MRPLPIGLFCCLLGWSSPSEPAVLPAAMADDQPSDEAARAARMIAEEAKRWEIQVGNDPSHTSGTGKDPNLRYTNPGVGRVHGSVYLFVKDGRPAAVMAIYKWFSPWTGFEAEMQSLSTLTLTGKRDGQVVWHPDRGGIEWRDVPNAPRPMASAGDRLGQMRSIASGFAACLVDSRVTATGEGQALRLLPKPIYRSEAHDSGVFAFVLGTDPEVFLLLETSETSGEPRWRYGLARLNSDPLLVTLGGKEVWKVAKIADRYDPRATYFSKELPQTPFAP